MITEYTNHVICVISGGIIMYTRIGGKIRKAREEKGYSQHELGMVLGLTATAINYYEKGKRKVSIEDIYRLSAVLKKPVEYFLSDVKQRKINQIPLTENDKPEMAKKLVGIPVLGNIHAGDVLVSEQSLLGLLPAPDCDASFALVVKGDSMEGKGICDGDLVLIRRQNHVDFNGQIICALISGKETSLKIYLREEGKIVLRSANPSYSDIVFDNDSSFTIQGVYAGVFKLP
jgi:repressor LexA